MLRISHKIPGSGLLDDLPPVHDEDTLGEVPHRRQVVGDVDDARLYSCWSCSRSSKISTRTEASSIETGSSATISCGSQDDRPGDHQALLLAAAELVGKLGEEILDGRELDVFEGPANALFPFIPVSHAVDDQGLFQDAADVHKGRQGAEGVLLDVAHLRSGTA